MQAAYFVQPPAKGQQHRTMLPRLWTDVRGRYARDVDGSIDRRQQGTPERLSQQVTPMLVSVTNDTGAPIRIAYQQFSLASTGGHQYAALPPFDIEAVASTQVGMNQYPPTRFGYAAYMHHYFAAAAIYSSRTVRTGTAMCRS